MTDDVIESVSYVTELDDVTTISPFAGHQPAWCPPTVCFVNREFPTNPCSRFEFYLCTVGIATLCIVGLALNTLSVVIFSKDRHNSVPTFLFKSLAIADNAVLLISLLILSTMLGPFQIPSARLKLRFVLPYLKKYLNPWGYVAQACTIWLTVALSVHRYIAICHPFVCKRVMTLARVRIEVAIIVTASVVANIPRFFQYDIYWEPDKTDQVLIPRKSLTPLGNSQAFDMFYTHVFYTFIILVFPLLFLIFFNVFICHKLNSARKRMKLRVSAADAAFNSRQDRGINVVMVIIVVQLLICHSPDRIVIALKFLESQLQMRALCLDTLFYWSHVSNLLIIINSSTDFFIYFAFKPRFRLILARCCFKGSRRERYQSVRTPSLASQKQRPSLYVETVRQPYQPPSPSDEDDGDGNEGDCDRDDVFLRNSDDVIDDVLAGNGCDAVRIIKDDVSNLNNSVIRNSDNSEKMGDNNNVIRANVHIKGDALTASFDDAEFDACNGDVIINNNNRNNDDANTNNVERNNDDVIINNKRNNDDVIINKRNNDDVIINKRNNDNVIITNRNSDDVIITNNLNNDDVIFNNKNNKDDVIITNRNNGDVISNNRNNDYVSAKDRLGVTFDRTEVTDRWR